MKRLFCLLTVLILLLCGCFGETKETKSTIIPTASATTTERIIEVTDAMTTTTTDLLAPTSTDETTVSMVLSTTAKQSLPIGQATTEAVTTVTSTTTKATSTTATAITTVLTPTTKESTTTKVTVTAKTTKKPTTKSATTTTATTTTTTAPVVKGVTLLEPENGVVLESQAEIIEKYLAITDEKEAAEFWTGTYTHAARGASFFASWESEGMLWKVYLSQDPQFKDVQPVVTTNQWMQFCGLVPGCTYYWKVVNGFGVSSEVRSVTVKDTTVCWVDADGGDNIRDLGGWKTEDGKTVKYGLLYRGGCIDGYKGGPQLTQAGRDVFKQLGIKTEIDLRGSDVSAVGSPFGGKYFKTEITQYDYIFNSNTTKASLKSIFTVLSNRGFYPVYVHCNAGADRTGTFAFILNGLLGVSYEDLTRDFELTGFSGRGKRLRSKIDEETGTFAKNGVMQNGDGNYIAWGPLYDKMMANYGTDSGKLSDAIANFLITECGVTQQQIDAVRNIMLE